MNYKASNRNLFFAIINDVQACDLDIPEVIKRKHGGGAVTLKWDNLRVDIESNKIRCIVYGDGRIDDFSSVTPSCVVTMLKRAENGKL